MPLRNAFFLVLLLGLFATPTQSLSFEPIKRHLIQQRSLGRVSQAAIPNQLRISPDGKRIAFVTGADGKIFDPTGDARGGATKVRAVVDGKAGRRYDGINNGGSFGAVLFSPDSQHFAYVASESGRTRAVIDKRQGIYFVTNATVVFSPDSQKVAYIATVEGRECLVVNEINEACFKSVLNWPLFSPDSKRLALVASDGKRNSVVVDNQSSDWTVRSSTVPVFSSDSSHFAYIATTSTSTIPSESFVVLDNNEGKHYAGIGDFLVFSPDGRKLAYPASIKVGSVTKEIVVVDGKEGGIHDGIIGALKFSSDSKRVAYVARSGIKERYVVLDSKEGERFGYVGVPVFSADSKCLAYYAGDPKSGDYGLLIVEENGETRKLPGGYNPVFSPVGHQLAYVLKVGEQFSVILNGEKGKPYDDISEDLVFSPDGQHLAYAAKSKGKWSVVIDGQEGPNYRTVVVKALNSINELWASDSASSLKFDTPHNLHYIVADDRHNMFLVEEHL